MNNFKQKLFRVNTLLRSFGFNPALLIYSLKGVVPYFRDYYKFKKQKGKDNKFYFGPTYPSLGDRFFKSGRMSGQYFHQVFLLPGKYTITIQYDILILDPEQMVL